MIDKHWAKVHALFGRAVELPPEERGAFLEQECGGDAEIVREVLELIEADNEASAFLEDGALTHTDLAHQLERHWVGRQFGAYSAIRELGRGGMGVVLLGERSDGRYKSQVAIKVIHTALMRGELVQRFRTEGQILADLDHPNVSRPSSSPGRLRRPEPNTAPRLRRLETPSAAGGPK